MISHSNPRNSAILFKLILVFLLALTLKVLGAPPERILNGIPVNATQFPQVVMIESDGIKCTATYVGPRALLTAARCISPKNPAVTFYSEGKLRKAIGIKSDLGFERDHDLAVVVVFEHDFRSVPISVGAPVKTQAQPLVLGYGCSEVGTKEDGILRLRTAIVNELMGFTFTATRVGLCTHDIGGPAILPTEKRNIYQLLGVSSKMNSDSTALFTRTDNDEAKALFVRATENYNAGICGATTSCPAGD